MTDVVFISLIVAGFQMCVIGTQYFLLKANQAIAKAIREDLEKLIEASE